MRNKPVSLADDIRNAIPKRNRGVAPWFEKLPADTLKELEKVRKDWHSGKIAKEKYTVARVISDTLEANGIATIKRQAVVAWLEQN
jgi:hypothetical protein